MAGLAPPVNASAAAKAQDVAPPQVTDVLRESGSPLPEDVRREMEPRFGFDFSKVRVHAGARAADAAESVQAKAFTVGPHVVFRERMPEVGSGYSLWAHELTHVVQQRGAAFTDRPRVGSTRSAFEHEAGVAARSSPGFVHGRASLALLQREPSATLRRRSPPVGESTFDGQLRMLLEGIGLEKASQIPGPEATWRLYRDVATSVGQGIEFGFYARLEREPGFASRLLKAFNYSWTNLYRFGLGIAKSLLGIFKMLSDLGNLVWLGAELYIEKVIAPRVFDAHLEALRGTMAHLVAGLTTPDPVFLKAWRGDESSRGTLMGRIVGGIAKYVVGMDPEALAGEIAEISGELVGTAVTSVASAGPVMRLKPLEGLKTRGRVGRGVHGLLKVLTSLVFTGGDESAAAGLERGAATSSAEKLEQSTKLAEANKTRKALDEPTTAGGHNGTASSTGQVTERHDVSAVPVGEAVPAGTTREPRAEQALISPRLTAEGPLIAVKAGSRAPAARVAKAQKARPPKVRKPPKTPKSAKASGPSGQHAASGEHADVGDTYTLSRHHTGDVGDEASAGKWVAKGEGRQIIGPPPGVADRYRVGQLSYEAIFEDGSTVKGRLDWVGEDPLLKDGTLVGAESKAGAGAGTFTAAQRRMIAAGGPVTVRFYGELAEQAGLLSRPTWQILFRVFHTRFHP